MARAAGNVLCRSRFVKVFQNLNIFKIDGKRFSDAYGHTPHSASGWCVIIFWSGRPFTRQIDSGHSSGSRVFRGSCSEPTKVLLFPEATFLEGAAGSTLRGCSQAAGLASV